MKTSIIKSIEPRGSWEGKYGVMYTFKVSFEDGQALEVNSKSEQPPYKVGDEMAYQITDDNEKFGAKGKVMKPDQQNYSGGGGGGNSNRDEMIMKQTALKCAAEFNAQRTGATPDQVIKDASLFFVWLKNNNEGGEQ